MRCCLDHGLVKRVVIGNCRRCGGGGGVWGGACGKCEGRVRVHEVVATCPSIRLTW